jgi:PAS domain S-box-containing protein
VATSGGSGGASGTSASARPPALSRRARVLIVDDNTELVGTLHAVLMSAEMNDGRAPAHRVEVVTASCGEDGLAVARSQGFDVAIVDVKLPDASGVDLIRPLRDACPLGEVVLITGFASMDAAIGALRSGAFAFVPKSFRPEELISTVEQALIKVRISRERDELERRYRALVELTDVLVIGLDDGNRVGLFNRKTAMLAGLRTRDALGRDFLAGFIPPEDRLRLREAIAQAREGESARSRAREIETGFADQGAGAAEARVLEVSSRSSDEGSTLRRRVRWHLSSAREPGESEGLVYGIGIDVTERRALEKRAADAEALSAMGTLALNLAHEIRNPLNAAVLQLHLLGRHIDKLDLDGAVRGALHKKTGIVGDEIGRLNRLLTEFLELARPRSIAHEPVKIAALVDAVLDLERDSATARGVKIERDFALPGAVVRGDSEKLKQVVINLIVNALEAMKDGGTLTARVGGDSDRVILAVEDTGPGMESQVLAQVFEPFFTTKEAGTGLGLSIVRKIVDQHAGEVRIESERGKGTRVRVTLPAHLS